jgi:hypothetical protein
MRGPPRSKYVDPVGVVPHRRWELNTYRMQSTQESTVTSSFREKQRPFRGWGQELMAYGSFQRLLH